MSFIMLSIQFKIKRNKRGAAGSCLEVGGAGLKG